MHEFKVWAPNAQRMQLVCQGEARDMERSGRGCWSARVAEDAQDVEYAFLIDDDAKPYPDPRSLWQPLGVHEPSRVYDHARFQWTDAAWEGVPFVEAVIYELHIGTFSAEGTFDGAIAHLDHLVELGITHVEVMPVAAFAGERGWGYDGVALFAVAQPYGGPDGFKRFVDACHAKGLAVILDVVYNHFGPVGNYAPKFGPYLTERYVTPWGAAVNLDQPGSDEVRRYFCDNALMWLRDYHTDGLRLDAVHEYLDRSGLNFMEQLAAEVDELEATLKRPLTLIAESDLNDPRVVRPRSENGYGIDAQWSDDFHHALFALLTEEAEHLGYYRDFGTMDDFVKALTQVFVYDGRFSEYRGQSHGRPAGDLPAQRFLAYIQNHDQVGNRALGDRIEHLVGSDAARVAMGLVVLAPFIPMLFMGDEFSASSPFLYFADHEDPEMARSVSEGRKREFAGFGFAGQDVPDPEDRRTFERSRLPWNEASAGAHAAMFEWTKALIRLRRSSRALQDGDRSRLQVRSDAEKRWLWMRRGEFRIVANVAAQDSLLLPLEEGEEIVTSSRETVCIEPANLNMPAMTLVVLRKAHV